MKRKLGDRDAAEAVSLASKGSQQSFTFDSFGLDSRILQAIVQEKYSKPTPVQAKAIPLALEGKDILARSQTGSGKTLAYVLPILQSILSRKSVPASSKATTALILVPTHELAGQVWKVIQALTAFCTQEARAENLTKKEDDKVQRARLADSPDIIVATPGRIVAHLNHGALKLDNLRHVVIDEADLVLSYGYDEDLQNIAKAIPKGVQTFLMSATLRAELDTLKGLFCRHPVVLELDDEEKDAGGGVTQYVVKCAEDEKFLLLFALFKLQLVKGKTIVFVGDIDRCYRMKLFLEQFGIKSCVLNSELPVNSRIHVVEEFNKGVYDIIIASDEQEVIGNELGRKRKSNNEADEEQGEGGSAPNGQAIESGQKEATNVNEQEELDEPSAPPKKRRRRDRDPDYGISRGIDFKNVTCVLNFDLPSSSKSYTHRVGRTGRAGKTGMAISFVIPESQYKKHNSLSITSTKEDEFVLKKIVKAQEKKGRQIKDYSFDMKKLEGFRYRLQSALSAVSASAIREARLRELRQELIKSEKLKRHFEENPDELRHLRHDGELRAARVKRELKHVPDYLLPGGGKKLAEDVGFVGLKKRDVDGNRIRKARQFNRSKGKGRRDSRGGGGRKNNPLKTFK